MARARDGDRDAFRELVETHQERIFRLAMRTLRCRPETAEDLCQEVFLRAWKALPRFDGAVRFGTWIHKIAVHACISEYRRNKALKRSGKTLSIDQPFGGDEDDAPCLEPAARDVEPGERAHQIEFARAAREALAHLAEEFRDAVLLRDMQGLNYDEISEILEVPAGTVRSRIHRGRAQLQQLLEEFLP